MLTTDYFKAGLGAGAQNGHAGAATIAAYYLSRDHLPAEFDSYLIDRVHLVRQGHRGLFEVPSAYGEEAPEPHLLNLIAEGVGVGLEAGDAHATVWGTAMLRTLHDHSDLAVPSVVHGLRAAQNAWVLPADQHRNPALALPTVRDVILKEGDGPPPYRGDDEMVTAAFKELEVVYENFPLPGAGGANPREGGWYRGSTLKTHLVTLTHAVCQLAEMGFDDLARQGRDVQRRFLTLARMPPPVGDPERHRIASSPYESLLDPGFWFGGLAQPTSAQAPLGRAQSAAPRPARGAAPRRAVDLPASAVAARRPTWSARV